MKPSPFTRNTFFLKQNSLFQGLNLVRFSTCCQVVYQILTAYVVKNLRIRNVQILYRQRSLPEPVEMTDNRKLIAVFPIYGTVRNCNVL